MTIEFVTGEELYGNFVVASDVPGFPDLELMVFVDGEDETNQATACLEVIEMLLHKRLEE